VRKFIAAFCVFTGLACVSFAQQAAPTPQTQASAAQLTDDAIALMRKDIRSQKKQLVAANLPLTDQEAEKFWPLYDKYTADTTKLNDTRYALIKQYATEYNSMTDAQADSLIKRWISTDQDSSALRLKWIPEFEKIIPAKKTAMFFQIDRRASLIVDLQLASQIPVVQP